MQSCRASKIAKRVPKNDGECLLYIQILLGTIGFRIFCKKVPSFMNYLFFSVTTSIKMGTLHPNTHFVELFSSFYIYPPYGKQHDSHILPNLFTPSPQDHRSRLQLPQIRHQTTTKPSHLPKILVQHRLRTHKIVPSTYIIVPPHPRGRIRSDDEVQSI